MAFNDADFGSESDDEPFNPQPDIGSDDEVRNESDAEEINTSAGGKAQAQRPLNEDKDDNQEGQNGHRKHEDGDESGNEDADMKSNNGGSDDDNGDEDHGDDDDEDDDEEDAVTGRPRKRIRRDPRYQFLDVEAEVSEDDEGDDEDDEGQPDGFIADTHPDDLADLPAGAETDDRRHRELDRKREMEASLDAEKQAQAFKERHHNYLRNRPVGTDSVVVPKRLLMPSVDDPSIWGVRCKQGKENEVVFALMKRIEERALSKHPLPIISALGRGGTMMGYIYIEARRQTDILEALDGLSNVYPRTKMVLVPIKEMPDLLRVTKSATLEPGGYVRMNRGKYKGDLAQIDDVETNGLEVTVRVVPRIDYGSRDDPGAPANRFGDPKRKRPGVPNPVAPRPPQRLFSEVEAKKHNARALNQVSNLNSKHFTYMGETYINGYLTKDVKIQHLITENVNPKLDEVTRFAAGDADGTENLDLAALAASLKNATAGDDFLPGDMVEVYTGEQQGVSGKTISVHGDIVTVNVIEGDLRGQTIDVPVKGLRKRFREGDHVKIIGGSKFRDEVGMVVRIKEDRVTVVSDTSMQEITVFSKDLREATDSGGAAGGAGKYDIHDLVQLNSATVACVIKVDRESLTVVDQDSSVRTILPSQIANKLERRRHAVATDRNGSEIRHDDTVREWGAEQRTGTILHIYRNFLFLHNREQTENSGVFVARSSNVQTVAAKGGRLTGASAGPDLTKMNPALQRNGGANGSPMPPPKSFGRDRAVGQTVTIRKGPYKGLLGIVKDTTDLEARVELHTKSKTIAVPKETLGFKDPMTGQSIDYSRFSSSRGGRGGFGGGFGGGGRTPAAAWSGGGSRTPMAVSGIGSRTPAWNSSSARTPAWSAGNTARTPAWKSSGNDGSRTSNPYADGSRTAYGGSTSYGGSAFSAASGKTPAWNPSARTPYGESSQTFDAFAAGSKTPAYGAPSSTSHEWNANGGRTPAFNPSSNSSTNQVNSAPTPGADFSAPTPGGELSAPTPAAYAAPTPGAFNVPTPRWGADTAPTPGATGPGAKRPYDAPTPGAGAWNAATPGGWGDDDGPRYDDE